MHIATVPQTVGCDGSVFCVKAKVRHGHGAPGARQSLIFNDEELVNGRTVHDYNIAGYRCGLLG
jgi:hypothetical protein